MNANLNSLPNVTKPSRQKMSAWTKQPKKKSVTLLNHSAEKEARNNNLHEIVQDFAGHTTAHGVSYLIASQTIIGRIFWGLIAATALGCTCYLGINVMKDFLDWPYTTKIELVTRFNLDFPAVTVCNINRLRRSQLLGTRFQGLIDIDGFFSDDEYSWFFDWDDSWMDFWDTDLSIEEITFGESTEWSEGDEVSEADSTSQSSFDYEYYVGYEYNEVSSTQPQNGTDERGDVESSEQSMRETNSEYARKKRAAPSNSETHILSTVNSRKERVDLAKDTVIEKGVKENNHVRKRQVRSAGEKSQRTDESSYSYFEFYDYNWGSLTADDWDQIYKNSQTDDFSNIIDVANPTREELEEFGHQAEDFILQCTFDKISCNYTNFKIFQNKNYGNCFTFNHGTGSDTLRTTSKSGAQFGLHLTLFIEQPDYVGIFTPESGVRVSVHHPKTKPFPEDDGLTAAPGFATSVGMKKIKISRLGDPYGDCQSEELLQADGQLSEYQYSSRECHKKCLQTELFERCQCVTDILLDNTKCSANNNTQQRCRQLVEYMYEEDKLECYCPTACEEITYTTSLSSSTWPSERYEEHFKYRLTEDEVEAVRLLDNVEQTRKNFVRLRVYFEELNFQEISQTPVYTMEGILGNLGGLMGLYFGGSLITVIEIIVFLFKVIKLWLKKMFGANRVQPIET